MAWRPLVGVGTLRQWLRKRFVVVERDEWPEGWISRDYVGGGDNVVEAISVGTIRRVNARKWRG